jgi:hypothetical protein
VAVAIKAGVPRFFPSEYTLDVTHPAARGLGVGSLIGARAAWADKLADIASTGKITYTTLVTGGFLDWSIRGGMLSFDVANRAAVLFDNGRNKVTACTVKFVGEALVTALQMPDEDLRNKRVYVAEVEYTGQGLLETLEAATGQKWRVEVNNTQAAQEKGRQLLAEGQARGAYVHFVLALNFNGSGAATLSSGLQFGAGYKLHRSSLKDIVQDALSTM